MGVSQVNHTTTATQAPRHGSQPPTCPAAWIERDELGGGHDSIQARGGRISQAPVHGGWPKAQCLLAEPANLQ